MDPTKLMPKSNMIGAAQQDMMWHTAAPNAQQAHGAVSVVTTVYSNVPAYPGPPQSFNTSTVHPNSGPNAFGIGGGASGIPPYGAAPGQATKSSAYCGDGSYTAYDQNYSSAGASDYGPTGPQQAALNAAQVAAAAVATATATAVAIDPSQFHQQYHPGSQPNAYGNGLYQSQMVQPNPYGANARGVQPRSQMPSQYMPTVRATRSQSNIRYPTTGMKCPPAATPGYPNGQQQPAPPYMGAYPGGQQQMLPTNQRAMMQTTAMYASNMGPTGGYNPRMAHARSPHYPMPQSAMSSQNSSMIPNGGYMPHPGYGHQMQQQIPAPSYEQHMRSNHQMYGSMTALPNNPTPPLTPAVSGVMIPPPGYPTGPGNIGGAPPSTTIDMKPAVNVQADDAEPRITIPVRDGILLQPFRLEHNAPVSQHIFILDDRNFHSLCTNSTYDLQLKCFHAEDKTMSNNWPNNANIQICVNGTPVAVRLVERPLYIKSLCQKQKNTLQIAVQQCCCSHLFILSLVTRPTVETVARQLVRQRLVSADHCIEKIRNFFHSGEAAQAQLRNVDNTGGNGESLQMMSITMSLKCPITMKRIELPARGEECRHVQCFDLRSYLEMNKERSTWLCPICKRLAPWDRLEIDQYVWGILTNLSSCDVDEVTIDGAAAWKPVGRQAVGGAMKDESDVPCHNAKRFKPDPGANGGNVCPWNQSNMQPLTPAAMSSQPTSNLGQQLQAGGANMPGSLYHRSANVLSPHFTGGSPGSASYANGNPSTPVPCHPNITGSIANGVQPTTSSFSSPNTPRQSVGPLTPYNSRGGPTTPVTPQQQYQNNPPSVGPPPRSVGNPPSVDNQNKSGHGSSSMNYGGQRQQSLQQQSSVDASFAGSAPYTPISVSSAGSQQGVNSLTNNSAGVDGSADFPDFTFDASDLLGSGDTNQAGGGLFNDPEELMKYLADDTDFGGFSFSGHNNAGINNTLSNTSGNVDEQRRLSHSMNAASNNASSKFSSSSVHQNNGYGTGSNGAATSEDLASMDDILSLLEK